MVCEFYLDKAISSKYNMPKFLSHILFLEIYPVRIPEYIKIYIQKCSLQYLFITVKNVNIHVHHKQTKGKDKLRKMFIACYIYLCI